MESTYTEYTTWKGRELIGKLSHHMELNSRFLNLFHTIFHNLNSYTANIRMLGDIADSEDHPEDRDAVLVHLKTVSEDLERTIADLSRIINPGSQETAKENLKLKPYIDRVQNTINSYGNDRKAAFVNQVPDHAFVAFNPAYMESILLNFCTNAIKYSHPDRFPIIVFNFFPENGKKVLTIADNGLGIDLDRYGDRLFGLYQTFHGHENAGGLGLYLNKYQIEAMKGEVGVESKVGEGTTFKIIFNE